MSAVRKPARAAQRKAAPRRATAGRERFSAFAIDALVVCPRCAGPAESRYNVRERLPAGTVCRLVCRRCGHFQDHAALPRFRGHPAREGRDQFLGLPLWLATPCCGEVLWAYNAKHLAALEAYVLAELRERRRDPDHGWSNAASESRMPKWIKLAKNRGDVAKGLARLRARLTEVEQ